MIGEVHMLNTRCRNIRDICQDRIQAFCRIGRKTGWVTYDILKLEVGAHFSPRQCSKEQVCLRLKFVVIQYVNKRVCPLPGNCFVVHGDISIRMVCWKKTFTISIVEAKVSDNVREKFVVALKQCRTLINGQKSKIYLIQTSALGIIGFYTMHTTLGLRPRAVQSTTVIT